MQSIIRSSSNRVKDMRVSTEKARSRRFALKVGWAVLIVILMAVFVLINLTMLQSFKEQPVYGFQRDERKALGVGPLLADMLKRRGFHKKPGVQQPSKKAADQRPVSNASMVPTIVAKDPLSNPGAGTDANKTQPQAVDTESLKDDPLAMADEKLEESLKDGNAASEASADGLDADVLAAAGGDADLALAAEAEADSQDAVTDKSYTAEAAKLEASIEAELAKGSLAQSSTTDQATQRLASAMDKYIHEKRREDDTGPPAKGTVTGNVSAEPKPSNATRSTG